MTIPGEIAVFTVTSKTTEKDRKSAIRASLPQIIAVTVKNILLLSYGTTVGYPTILIPSLSGENPEEIIYLNEDQISWISSINMMWVPLGCFLSGFVSQPLGRRRSMQLYNIPFFASWMLFRYSTAVWHVYVALAMTGLCGGLLEAPVLTYVAEVTQPHLRGMLSATSTFSVILGILVQFLLGSFLNWRTVALVCSALPIISFTLLMFVPESPYWLITKNKHQEAKKSLAWLRGWTTIEEIEHEYQAIINKQEENLTEKSDQKSNRGFSNFLESSLFKNYLRKSFVWPLFIVSFFFFVAHFTGSTNLQTYAVKLFAVLQVPIDKYHATIILGLAEFFGCVISVVLVHYTGKRVMGLISIIGNSICAALVGTYAYTKEINYFSSFNATAITEATYHTIEGSKWIPLTFLILLAFLSHCGIRSLSWILIGEVFSKETRAIGCGTAAGIGYIFGFLSNKIFLKAVALLTIPGTFWFYSSFAAISAIALYFILPETEGKTLQEISNHFAGKSKLDNKVRRSKKNHVTPENIDRNIIDSRL